MESEYEQRESLEQFQDYELESGSSGHSITQQKQVTNIAKMVELEHIFEAYYDCMREKSSAADALAFSVCYFEELAELCEEINDRRYVPSTSVTFIVTRPTYREVFAAAFRDRIIHHYIALRIEPLLEAFFTDRTFNCRKGKGALFGVKMLRDDIRKCSNNYTEDCWVLKLDIKGFFMSIPKNYLCAGILAFVRKNYKGKDLEDLLYVLEITVMHEPQHDCVRHSPEKLWERLPKNKSLFTNEQGRGIAIGNLTSQLLANFLLDALDKLFESIGLMYHGRYVDDFYNVHGSKKVLLRSIKIIRSFLRDELGLTLHPDKFYLQHYTKGVAFTGAVVKRDRIYTGNRNIAAFCKLITEVNRTDFSDLEKLYHYVSSINSYLGLMRHSSSYALRRKILGRIKKSHFKYIYISGKFEVVKIKSQYKELNVWKRRVTALRSRKQRAAFFNSL